MKISIQNNKVTEYTNFGKIHEAELFSAKKLLNEINMDYLSTKYTESGVEKSIADIAYWEKVRSTAEKIILKITNFLD